MSDIAGMAQMHSRDRGDRALHEKLSQVSAIQAQLRAILMYIATGCTSLVLRMFKMPRVFNGQVGLLNPERANRL